MNDKPETAGSFGADAGWLEVVEGHAPILLIAPHGGRAGAAAHARLHPRINDLHTAEITRELSRRLHACAMINSAMDRNALDCNRVEDIAHKAPWVLAMVAERVEQMVKRHGRALVLVIHGWNVVEARIDFGVGGRVHSGQLRPVNSGHITASRRFINGPLAHLCAQLKPPASIRLWDCAIPPRDARICCRYSHRASARAGSNRCATSPPWPPAA